MSVRHRDADPEELRVLELELAAASQRCRCERVGRGLAARHRIPRRRRDRAGVMALLVVRDALDMGRLVGLALPAETCCPKPGPARATVSAAAQQASR